MISPLDSIIQKAEYPSGVSLALVLSLLFVLLLSGCEAPSSTPGFRPGGAVSGRPGGMIGAKAPVQSMGTTAVKSPAGFALKPGGDQTPVVQTASALLPAKPDSPSPITSEKTTPEALASVPASSQVNAFGPTAKVEQAGITVELASSIILAKANPFLDWLPKALVSSDVSSGSVAADTSSATPTDPFGNVILLGVMSHGKKAMALIGVGDGQSQFAEKGSVINLEGGMAKVVAVRADGVDLQLLGNGAQTRTLNLPDIIGYSSAASSGANGQVGTAGAQSMTSGASVGSSSDKTSSALENLKKIFEQSSGGTSSSPSGASTQVNLQER